MLLISGQLYSDVVLQILMLMIAVEHRALYDAPKGHAVL